MRDMFECVVQTGFQMVFGMLWLCLVNLGQEQVQKQILKRRWLKNSEQPRDQFLQSVCNDKFFCYKMSGWFNKDSGVFFWFYISRFLLICHWESLNLTYTTKWFFFLENISEHHLRAVLGTGCSGCSLAKLQKTVFNDFFLDFWANVSKGF